LRRPATPAGRGRLEPIAYRGPRPSQGAIGGESAQRLISDAVQAKGGLEKLRSIRTVKADATVWIDAPGGRVEVRTTTWIRYPDAFRVDAQMPTGPVSQVLVGDSYWIRDARGTVSAPEDVARDLRGSIQRDAIRLLLAMTEKQPALNRVVVTVDGQKMPAIEVRSASGRAAARAGDTALTLVFDPASTLLARLRYAVQTAQGVRGVEEVFSDYRDVNGLKVAFKAVVQREGSPRVERLLRNFEYNIPLDASLFERSL
jgi:hypothetical protein